MTALSDRLNQARGDESTDTIAERATRAGHPIDRSVVFRALNGEHAKQPRESTLQALAAGFNIPVQELRELAGRPPGEPEPWTPPAVSASLTRDQRAALDALIKAIVHTDANPAAETPTDEVPPAILHIAARRGVSEGEQLRRVHDSHTEE